MRQRGGGPRDTFSASQRLHAFIAVMYVLHVTGRSPRSRSQITKACNAALVGSGAGCGANDAA